MCIGMVLIPEIALKMVIVQASYVVFTADEWRGNAARHDLECDEDCVIKLSSTASLKRPISHAGYDAVAQ